MLYGYIQILIINNKWRILFTPNEEYINNNNIIDKFDI